MASQVVIIPASDLVEDDAVYPRGSVDSGHVRDLALALEACEELPPVIADRKTRRIVDGFHRRRAYVRAFGVHARMPVEYRDYPREQDLLKEAIALNADHGLKLNPHDRARSAVMLEKAGVSRPEIAVILRTTQERVAVLTAKVVLVKDKETRKETSVPVRPAVALDRTRAAGFPYGHQTAQMAAQVARDLRSGLVDLETPGLRDVLADLAEAIKAAI